MSNARKAVRLALLATVLALSPAVVRGESVTLCHRPPGDPANAKTIHVGAPSAAAHLRHGDALGECAPSCRDNGASCAGAADCCSGTCSGGTCVAPCTADGGTCASSAECCGGICSDQNLCASSCTAGGPELDQPACSFDTPCCPGYGNCIQGFCWTEASCSLLAEPCDDLAGVVCCFDYTCESGTCVAFQ